MINRPYFIRGITPFLDKPLVKILSGVRRCGKSTIFEMLHDELIAAMGDRPRCYPLLDEIQAIDGWEKRSIVCLNPDAPISDTIVRCLTALPGGNGP